MINSTRTGKIARLPHDVREQLNHRLFNGESGRKLLAWLNELPEVRAVLIAEFGGEPRAGQGPGWPRPHGDAEMLTLSLAGHHTAAMGRLQEPASHEE